MSPGEIAFEVFNAIFMLCVVVMTVYPFLNVLALSLNDSLDTVKGGIHIWPRQFTLENYKTIFGYETLIIGARNSVLRTIIGTILSVFCCSMIAYTLSRKDFQLRKFFSVFLALTMYLSAGLIPGYMLIRHLGMINTFWVYIIPGIVSAWNVFIIRSFMDNLPYALQESAKLDGANDFTIYARIILPLCKPVLATVALFVAVGQWNSWFDNYLYNSSKIQLTTLQYELQKILQSTTVSQTAPRGTSVLENMARVSPQSVKMAITIVVTVPILVVYPFLQKYFVKGMTLGAVKA
jgi:putative aldouronate transport system permease protein